MQKAIIEFIAFVFNSLCCDFIVTTHSPYVLAFVNDLLYAERLGRGTVAKGVKALIPQDFWIDANDIEGYFVDQRTVCPLLDKDIPALKWEALYHASDEIGYSLVAKMLDIQAASHAKKTR